MKFNISQSHHLPISEILCVKNVRAIVVWGFLVKQIKKEYAENMKKKIVGAVSGCFSQFLAKIYLRWSKHVV